MKKFLLFFAVLFSLQAQAQLMQDGGTYSSVKELRRVTQNGMKVFVLGARTKGERYELQYEWNAQSVETPVPNIIVNPDGGATGRWKVKTNGNWWSYHFNLWQDADTLHCSMTAGNNIMTSDETKFLPTDTGKIVTINAAGGKFPILKQGGGHDSIPKPLRGKIVGYISSSQVVVDFTATVSVTSQKVYYGHDDAPGVQAAINYLTSINAEALRFARGWMCISSSGNTGFNFGPATAKLALLTDNPSATGFVAMKDSMTIMNRQRAVAYTNTGNYRIIGFGWQGYADRFPYQNPPIGYPCYLIRCDAYKDLEIANCWFKDAREMTFGGAGDQVNWHDNIIENSYRDGCALGATPKALITRSIFINCEDDAISTSGSGTYSTTFGGTYDPLAAVEVTHCIFFNSQGIITLGPNNTSISDNLMVFMKNRALRIGADGFQSNASYNVSFKNNRVLNMFKPEQLGELGYGAGNSYPDGTSTPRVTSTSIGNAIEIALGTAQRGNGSVLQDPGAIPGNWDTTRNIYIHPNSFKFPSAGSTIPRGPSVNIDISGNQIANNSFNIDSVKDIYLNITGLWSREGLYNFETPGTNVAQAGGSQLSSWNNIYGINVSAGSSINMKFHDNDFSGLQNAIVINYLGSQFHRNLKIYNNAFHDIAGKAIFFRVDANNHQTENAEVYDNTFDLDPAHTNPARRRVNNTAVTASINAHDTIATFSGISLNSSYLGANVAINGAGYKTVANPTPDSLTAQIKTVIDATHAVLTRKAYTTVSGASGNIGFINGTWASTSTTGVAIYAPYVDHITIRGNTFRNSATVLQTNSNAKYQFVDNWLEYNDSTKAGIGQVFNLSENHVIWKGSNPFDHATFGKYLGRIAGEFNGMPDATFGCAEKGLVVRNTNPTLSNGSIIWAYYKRVTGCVNDTSTWWPIRVATGNSTESQGFNDVLVVNPAASTPLTNSGYSQFTGGLTAGGGALPVVGSGRKNITITQLGTVQSIDAWDGSGNATNMGLQRNSGDTIEAWGDMGFIGTRNLYGTQLTIDAKAYKSQSLSTGGATDSTLVRESSSRTFKQVATAWAKNSNYVSNAVAGDSTCAGCNTPTAKFDINGDLRIRTVPTATSNYAVLVQDSTTGKVLRVAKSALGGGGSTSPGGSDTYVQFNDVGAFNGISSITINKASNLLNATNLTVSGTAKFTGVGSSTALSDSIAMLATDGTLKRKFVDTASYGQVANNTELDAFNDYPSRVESYDSINGGRFKLIISSATADNINVFTATGKGSQYRWVRQDGRSRNIATGTIGQMVYYDINGQPLLITPNATTTKKVLTQIGDGTNVTSTAWGNFGLQETIDANATTNKDNNITNDGYWFRIKNQTKYLGINDVGVTLNGGLSNVNSGILIDEYTVNIGVSALASGSTRKIYLDSSHLLIQTDSVAQSAVLSVLAIDANNNAHRIAIPSGGGGGGGIADPGSNGILSRTALNTTAARTITGTSGNIVVSNGDGVSGNPTIDIGTNVATTAGTQTLTNKTINGSNNTITNVSLSSGVTGTLPFGNGGTGNTFYTDGQLLIGNTSTTGLTKATLTQGTGITITNGGGSITIASTGISDPGSNGIIARTSANTGTARTLTGTTNRISITNGDGVGGNPTFDIGSDVATQSGTNAFAGANSFTTNILNANAGLSTNNTGTNANLYIPASSTASTTTTSADLIGSNGTVAFRRVMRGSSTYAIAANQDYAGTIFGTEAVTKNATGTADLFANVAINQLTVNTGASTLNNATNLMVAAAPSNGTNNTSAWFKGAIRVDIGSDATGDLIYRSSSNGGSLTRLGIGSAGQRLGVSGGVPVWEYAYFPTTTASDANTTISAVNSFTILPVATANRTLTLPSGTVSGQELKIWNKNTSGTFSWSFSSTVFDASSSTITNLVNTSFYLLIWDGTRWVKQN